MNTRPSLEGVQFERVRKKKIRGLEFDYHFLDLEFAISQAFYGAADGKGKFDRTTGWKAGVNKVLQSSFINNNAVLDKLSTPVETQERYNRLIGLLYHVYILVFEKVNNSLPLAQRYPEEEWNALDLDEDTGVILERKTDLARTKIAEAQAHSDPLEIVDPTT